MYRDPLRYEPYHHRHINPYYYPGAWYAYNMPAAMFMRNRIMDWVREGLRYVDDDKTRRFIIKEKYLWARTVHRAYNEESRDGY